MEIPFVDPSQPITLEIIAAKLSELSLSVDNLRIDNQLNKTELISSMGNNISTISETITELRDTIKRQDDEIARLREMVARQDQYTRRNNIEIAGIPNDIDDRNLENKVVTLMKNLNIQVSPNDIEACHRLNAESENAPKRTIVRFVNRKFVNQLLSKRKALKSKKLDKIGLHRHRLYLNENLCSYYYKIWKKARLLFKHGLITRFWTYNGIPYVKVSENDDHPIQLSSMEKLASSFTNFDFENPPPLSQS